MEWIIVGSLAILLALLGIHWLLRRRLLARLGAVDPRRRRALGEARPFDFATLTHGWRTWSFIWGRQGRALGDPALAALVRGERWLYLVEALVFLVMFAAVLSSYRTP